MLRIDKRKHIRIVHSDTVKFATEGKTFAGKSLDISMTGMQVVVNIPESYKAVRRITFTLPYSDKSLDIPCKLVRVEKKRGSNQEQVLGIEFAYKAEAQMILIENFIREMRKTQLINGFESKDMRQLPRAMCRIKGIAVYRENIRVISIDNISTEGFLMSFKGDLKSNDTVQLEFSLPGNSRKLNITGRVTYVVENYFRNISSAGISFEGLREIDRVKIYNFIVASSSSSAMKSLHERFSSYGLDEEYRIINSLKITSIFELLNREDLLVNVLFENSLKIFELQVTDFHPAKEIFITSMEEEILSLGFNAPVSVYFSFYLQGGCYYFKTKLLKFHNYRMIFKIPRVLYQSEKRSYQRKLLGEDIELSLEYAGSSNVQLYGKLVDISRRGFLCEVPLTDEHKYFFRSGQVLNYDVNKSLGLDTHGEIRHFTQVSAVDGSAVLRIGIETGIKRSKFKFKKFKPQWWNGQKLYQKDLPLHLKEQIESIAVRYRNKEGQEISALVNITRKHVTAPVVVLPPAFGKKKETLSPLVSTLFANFRHMNRDIVTIRYDGINRPGESYNEEKDPKRGYEMLRYRISQGKDDLKTTLDYVYDNPYFTPEKVILVTFSMSALDARKLIMIQKDKKVDYWISVMGIPSAQTVIGNILGGMDIIGNYKMNIPNGICGMLGHLIDMDNLAQDLIHNKYAFITDSRLDMSKISIPVLWIYGTYDKWMVIDEIKDVMSVRAGGSREIIEVPTGHNLRSSEDAVKTFKLITSSIYEKLYDQRMKPIDPDKEEMVRLITYERERISSTEEIKVEDYWKNYLIGSDGNNYGYDFYKNIKDFRDFLTLETGLIAPADNDRIADMGCGTGLFVDNMLQNLACRKNPVQKLNIVAVDLIQEALDKTRVKYEKLVHSYESLRTYKIEYIRMNLDPNRLIPVKRFMDDTRLDFNFLRNRVEGLKNVTLDLLLRNESKKLYRLTRGGLVTDDVLKDLEKIFNGSEYRAVTDFNRAARFLKRNLYAEDLIPKKRLRRCEPLKPEEYCTLSTRDILFETLNFGDNGLNLHLDFRDNYFNKIVASLFISYLFNPDDIMHEFYRMLRPGGILLVSTMKPDSDISVIFTDYIEKVRNFELEDTQIKNRDLNLSGARAMLNEAAALFELEEDGYFKFYTADELVVMFKTAGFRKIQVNHSLGNPSQAVIVTGKK